MGLTTVNDQYHGTKIMNNPKITCTDCKLSDHCIPFGLQVSEVEALKSIIKNKRPLQAKQWLYSIDEPCESIYVVKAGSFKSSITNPEGLEQTIGIYFPGEFIGLDGLFKGRFDSSVASLETSVVCELPLTILEDLCSKTPNLQHRLIHILSREINTNHKHMQLLGKGSAKEKVASFLLTLSNKHSRLGYSDKEFNLNISRDGIGNFLCLSPETVSRQLAILITDNIIEVNNNFIKILDLIRLEICTQP
jgi:CRP/FNR family transcriptional regulator